MGTIYSLRELEIPIDIAQKNGPYKEFKQDVSIVTVKTLDGCSFERVMLLYPNYVIAVAEQDRLPFKPSSVVEVTQAPQVMRKHNDSNWVYWYDSNQVV
ncbi:MAG: hypothetical protein HWE10_13685 [Gammaproteobacteria bacterium]|nr:hypothetical protein [Gammaproteobacteria bacterium]